MNRLPITVLIPTLNEERNIATAIRSVLDCVEAKWVVDSFSTDRTQEIVEELGAGFVKHPFENHASQKNWALANLPIKTEWILFLDADEFVPQALWDEIRTVLVDYPEACNGYYIGLVNHLLGAPMYHGAFSPDWRLLLFRRGHGRFERRTVHEHLIVDGPVRKLKHYLIQNDRKGFERYFDRHNTYSTLEAFEALEVIANKKKHGLAGDLFGTHPERRRWLKSVAYRYGVGRPLMRFAFSYFIKLGFLDGRAGFRHAALQMFYDYQVSLKMIELRSDPTSPMYRRLNHEPVSAIHDGTG